MRITSKFTIVMAGLALAGCMNSGNPSDTIINGANGGNEVIDLNITASEAMACNMEAKPETLFGVWRKNASNQDADFMFMVNIQRTTITYSKTCIYKDGRSLTVNARSPIAILGSNIQVMQKATEMRLLPGTALTCSVTLNPGAVPYNFSGGCLGLRLAPGYMLFMPSF
ncbi:MAG: hypothetical protein V4736_00755 [Bdellovibrionota bacterium]